LARIQEATARSLSDRSWIRQNSDYDSPRSLVTSATISFVAELARIQEATARSLGDFGYNHVLRFIPFGG